jgi:hypothetical protein
MSCERIFYLAELSVKELGTTHGVYVKAPDDVRPEMTFALTEESELEESIDSAVRKTLSTYSRLMPERSREREVLYEKTREEVYERRFRL